MITEINGFKIDKFNIHNLPDGVKYTTCPICSEGRKKKTQKCLSVFWSTGMAKCSHCGEVIQLHSFSKKESEQNYKVPEWNNKTELSDSVVKWFEGRKISQFVLRLMKISEGVEVMPPTKAQDKWLNKNTVQFPYFRNGQPINIKYRSGDKSFKLFKDGEKMAYNLDNIQGQEIIYCVEGEPDVLSVMECGIHNVCSPPNGFTVKGDVNLDWLNNDVEHFVNAEKIILAFDQDEAGRNGTKEFIRRFGAHRCFLVDLKDCKDSNDYLIQYGKEELKNALENYIEVPLENVSTYNDHKEGVRDFFLNGMPRGYVTGTIKSLDEIFSVNSGQPILVTGKPGSGKTEVVDQMCLGYALNYGFKTAFASPENKPNVLHHQKIIRKLVGIAPTEEKHFNKSFEDVEEFDNSHFFMIDMDNGYDLDGVLLKAEELVVRKGIKVLVIDPFNKVRLKSEIPSITGNKINDYTNQYLFKIEEFARKFDIIPILIAHPNKMPKEVNGKRAIPDMYDVKGGGEFYDMMPHGLVVERYYDEGFSMIRTLKVKFNHLGNAYQDAWNKFNINNGRYNQVIGDPMDPTIDIETIWDNSNWVTKSDEPIQNDLPIPDTQGLEPVDFDNYNPDDDMIPF